MYICIGGGGKVAEYLGNVFLKKGHEVAIIEKNSMAVDRLAETLTGRVMIIQGDTCNVDILRDAGIEHADVYVATTGKDDDNLVACEISQVVFDTPRVIARVNNPKNERIFKKLGVEGISSTTIISNLIEEEAMSGEERMMLSLRQGNLTFMEVELPGSGDNAELEGVRVADLDLPQSTVLVAVAQEDELNTVHGDTILKPGNTVVVCVKTDFEDEARQVLLSSMLE